MKKNELRGKTFGKLTVIGEHSKTPAGHITWKCSCECGKECVRTGTSLTRSKYSSCGCWSRSGKDNPLWKGVGDISAAWFYESVTRSAEGVAKGSRVKEINIDISYIWELFLKQNKRCAYTNLLLTFPTKSTNKGKKEATASLDRIDSSKGYIKGNVQWVHKHINIMKNTYSEKEFIKMCKLVALNN